VAELGGSLTQWKIRGNSSIYHSKQCMDG